MRATKIYHTRHTPVLKARQLDVSEINDYDKVEFNGREPSSPGLPVVASPVVASIVVAIIVVSAIVGSLVTGAIMQGPTDAQASHYAATLRQYHIEISKIQADTQAAIANYQLQASANERLATEMRVSGFFSGFTMAVFVIGFVVLFIFWQLLKR